MKELALHSAVAVDGTSAALIESYFGTLQSQKSRDTQHESFKRLARVVTGGKSDDYKSIPWHTLDFDGFSKVKALLADAYPPATANLSLVGLRRIIAIGVIRGEVDQKVLLAARETKGVKGKRVKRGRALEPAEEKRLWTVLKGLPEPKATLWKAVLAVLLGGGARREEVCALPIGGYRSGDLYILGKGNKERVVPCDRAMEPLLDAWIRVRRTIPARHQRLFLSFKGNFPLSVWALWFNVKGYTQAAGIKGITPHDFRRTFATRLLERGFDLAEVQRLMGHESVETTAGYDKRAEKRLAERRREVTLFSEAS